MYPITNLHPLTNDPISITREKTNRPASQLEIMQRNRQMDRLHWMDIAATETVVPSRERRTPGLFQGIRRSLSRVLIQAGERLDPQAA